MNRNASDESIKDRRESDIEAAELVRSGTEQFSFLSESNPDIFSMLDWFASQISTWDINSVDDPTKERRAEHIDAWALQRDVNYAYSDRKRLFDMGHDKRFEESYTALVRFGFNSESGKSGE